MRNAVASAWPRTIAASAAVSLRGGSGSRALPPAIPGRSAANATSSSGRRAMARRHPVTARLNGSFGASLAGVLGLMFEDMDERCFIFLWVEPILPMVEPMFVVSLKDYLMAEPENHILRLLREIRGAIGTVDTRVDSLDKKVDRNHEELKQRIENLRRPLGKAS